MDTKIKKIKRERRKKRIRAKIFGTAARPRFSVFRSNRYMTAQLVDDANGVTLAAATTKNVKSGNLSDKAKMIGQDIAKQALAKNIKEAVFDRGGYLYTGSVMSLAEGAREAGLKF